MTSPVDLIPALSDNYIAVLRSPDGRRAAIVDPAEAEPVEQFLEATDLVPVAILNTHHHPDHVGGNRALQTRYDLPVYGAAADRERIPGLTHPLHDGDTIAPPGLERTAEVWAVPGHTRGHIAFLFREDHLLFAGDTLFAAGCGRLFEGTPAEMCTSLTRLAGLPGETRLFCAHEYTLKNLRFAREVEPDNTEVAQRLAAAEAARERDEPTLPGTMAEERATNPFLRVEEPGVVATARHLGATSDDPVAVFAAIRGWRNRF